MMRQPVMFNNKELPEFIKVTGRSTSILPPINVNYKESSARQVGGIFLYSKLQPKQFKLDLTVIPDLHHSLDDMLDIFAEWLRGNDFKPSELSFIEQPERHVLAVVDGSTDITDLFVAGTGSISFSAVNPLKYLNQQLNQTVTSPTTVNYEGTVEQGINCVFTLSKACSRIELAVNDRKVILTGSFKKGSVITIDSDRKVVKVDGIVNMKVLALESNWLQLKAGTNSISVKLDNAASAEKISVSSKIAFY